MGQAARTGHRGDTITRSAERHAGQGPTCCPEGLMKCICDGSAGDEGLVEAALDRSRREDPLILTASNRP